MSEVYIVTYEDYEEFNLVGVYYKFEDIPKRCFHNYDKNNYNFYKSEIGSGYIKMLRGNGEEF